MPFVITRCPYVRKKGTEVMNHHTLFLFKIEASSIGHDSKTSFPYKRCSSRTTPVRGSAYAGTTARREWMEHSSAA